MNEIAEIHEMCERRNLEQPAYMRVNIVVAALSLRLGFPDELVVDSFHPLVPRPGGHWVKGRRGFIQNFWCGGVEGAMEFVSLRLK